MAALWLSNHDACSLLLEHKATVTAFALAKAVTRNNAVACRLFIDSNAENAKLGSDDEDSPLMIAVCADNVSIGALLLRARAIPITCLHALGSCALRWRRRTATVP
jgi:hypothetical protein